MGKLPLAGYYAVCIEDPLMYAFALYASHSPWSGDGEVAHRVRAPICRIVGVWYDMVRVPR